MQVFSSPPERGCPYFPSERLTSALHIFWMHGQTMATEFALHLFNQGSQFVLEFQKTSSILESEKFGKAGPTSNKLLIFSGTN